MLKKQRNDKLPRKRIIKPISPRKVSKLVYRSLEPIRDAFAFETGIFEKARMSDSQANYSEHEDLFKRVNSVLHSYKMTRFRGELDAIDRYVAPGRSKENFECENFSVDLSREDQSTANIKECQIKCPPKRRKKKSKPNISVMDIENNGSKKVSQSCQANEYQEDLRTSMMNFVNRLQLQRNDIIRFKEHALKKMSHISKHTTNYWRQVELGELSEISTKHHWSEQLSKYRKNLNHYKLMQLQRYRLAFKSGNQSRYP